MNKLSLVFLLIGPAVLSAQPLVGVGVTAGTLGIGVQGAVSVSGHSNIRGGFNAFSYSDGFTKDGISYNGTLKLRSVQLTYDQYFPHLGGFHVSPGVLLYDGNGGNATATVGGGRSFTLGGTTYYSANSNPVNGAATVTARKAAPMLVIGFGNLLPRSARHFGVNFDIGVVFQGSPNAKLNLSGTTCLNSSQTNCVNTATDPTVQSNLRSEQNRLNDDLKPFMYYPVVSLGFSYKF